MFSDYKGGGVRPVTGVVEAGANIGRMYQEGLTKLGAGIGDAIKSYNANKDKREVTTAEGAGLYENLKFMQTNIKDNPELAQFADRFQPLLDKFSKFDSMSTNQQAGFLVEAKAFQNQIVPNLAIYKEGLVGRTQQGVQSALSQKVSIPTEESGKPLEAVPYLPAKTTEENFALNRKAFEVQAEAQGLSKFNIESALDKLAKVWENSFANDPNLAKTDPKFRDTILKGLSDWRNVKKVAGEIESQTSEDYGTGENAMEQVAQLSESLKGATVAPATVMREQKAAEALAEQRKADGGKTEKPLSKREKEIEAVKERIKVDNKRIELLDIFNETDNRVIAYNLATTFFNEGQKKSWPELYSKLEKIEDARMSGDTVRLDKEVKETKTFLQENFEVAKSQLAGAELNLEELLKSPDDETKSEILKTKEGVDAQVKTLESELADLLKEQKKDTSYFTKSGSPAQESLQKVLELAKAGIANRAEIAADPSTLITKGVSKSGLLGAFGGALDIAGELGVFDPRTLAQKDLTKVAIANALDKKFPTAPLPERIKSIKDRIDTLKNVSTEAQKAVKAVETANEPEKPADTYAQPFNYNTKIQEGVVQGTRDETYAEEKERVRQWFVDNNKGIIPSSLDAVYKSIRPETDVKFMPAPDGGQVMITSKGAQYIPPAERKQMTDEQRSDVTLFNYGTPDASGTRIIPEERAKGSGIKLAGFVKGGKESAKEFKKLHDDTVQTRIIIPKLLAMYEKGKGERTLIPSEMWGEAESLLAKLKAAIRVETVGTGPVALPEHQMILERIGDPRKFFQFDTVGKSKLNSIMNSMQDSLKNNSAGIQVTFAPTAGDVKGLEQQARIEANKR